MKSLLRRIASLVSRMFDTPLGAPTDAERALWSQLRAEVERLPAPAPESASAAEAEWLGFLGRMRAHLLDDDPRAFLRWPVVAHTMFVTFAPFVLTELRLLRAGDWRGRWRSAIAESDVGHPPRYPLYPASSGNLIHYAYHLALFEQRTGVSLADLDCVVEFGGGYGGMCRLLHRLGFNGRYVIFDLPYFSALQRYYLRSNGLAVAPPADLAASGAGIACVSDVDDLRRVTERIGDGRKALFLATWSLSEAPLAVRQRVLPLTDGIGNVLVGYQERFGEIDNRAFFADWRGARPDLTWRADPIPHLPGNVYLYGCGR